MSITTLRTSLLAAATVLATLASAVILSAADPAPMVVHDLPRVVVTGQVQRDVIAQVVQLPRVVVTGQVQRDEAVQVAQLPRVFVTGQVQRDAVAQIVQLPRVVVTGHKVHADTAMAQAGRIAASGV